MRHILFALLIVEALLCFAAVEPVQARTDMSRTEIKAMPITERPNRAGHFYGNTVRRRHHRAER